MAHGKAGEANAIDDRVAIPSYSAAERCASALDPWMPSSNVDTVGLWDSRDFPLRGWAKFASTEMEAVHDHMVRAFCPHDLWREGGLPPMAFRHNQVSLRSATFNATDYGLPYGRVSLFIPPSESAYLVQFVLSGHAQFTHQGRTYDLVPGQLTVLSPHSPVRQITEAGCKHFTVKLCRKQLEAVLAEDLGFQPGPLSFQPEPVALSGPTASFSSFLRQLCDDVDRDGSAYLHPRTMATTEAMLCRLLLTSVSHNYSGAYSDAPRQEVAPYYVRRAEELIRARYADPLTLGDLIAAAGASGRSLHAGFRRFRDETPMGFLKKHRLDEARRLLQSGDGQGLNVTDIAFATGFLHPSKFAQDYRERFGETPSATLRMGRIGTRSI